jgi:hypothetical protein
MSVPIVLSSRTSVEREDDTRAMEEIVLTSVYSRRCLKNKRI